MSKPKVNRLYINTIQEMALVHNKMAFLSGPRQCGKTTLAKQMIPSPHHYYNWDDLEFKKSWTRSNKDFGNSLLSESTPPLIVLDEFHKNIKWKNQLKGFYDLYGEHVQIILTGSAHLNTYKKGSDSLFGRFYHFHIHPFTYAELNSNKSPSFQKLIDFINHPSDHINSTQTDLTESLFQYGGFPEPFLAQNQKTYNIWNKNRMELLIRQDLKELSQLMQIGQVELLASFLPERIGSPLSIQSLREDLDCAHTSVSRWLFELQKVYYHFKILPYTKSIIRSLKKEAKIYLYDWANIEDKGARFENMVACHLLKMIQYYEDIGEAKLELYYLRDKEKREVDFIVVKNQKPFFTVEVKLNETEIDQTHLQFQKKLMAPHFQVIKNKGYFKKHHLGLPGVNSYVIGFDQFFGLMV